MDFVRIARQLNDAFEASGLSYGDLSERTGIAKSALHRYLAGDTKKIPIDRLNDICNALGLNTQEIIGWKNEEKEEIHQEPPAPEEEQKATPEIQILARGMHKMTEEQQKQLLEVARIMFAKFFDDEEAQDNEN